jgi:alkane 1-monooxygenase
MNKVAPLSYLTAYSIYAIALFSLLSSGWLSYTTLLYVFGLVPLLELLFPAKTANLTDDEEQEALQNPMFDWVVWLTVPFQFAFIVFFLYRLPFAPDTATKVGWMLAAGICCGVFGINVAHELGHRKLKFEQRLAQALLLTSLYMHFFIEHNRGHHRYVSTPLDPASSRKGEWIYSFWVRSVVKSWFSAWNIEKQRLQKLGLHWLNRKNQMLQFQLIQLIWLVAIGVVFGVDTVIAYTGAALIGILLLETVNYIEHYGLQRRQLANGNYERVQPHHSWNSSHKVGRLLLFELSRHSDHHYLASRKYQILRHHPNVPQMPTGYPGMMLMALLPPLYVAVMQRKLSNQEALPSEV